MWVSVLTKRIRKRKNKHKNESDLISTNRIYSHLGILGVLIKKCFITEISLQLQVLVHFDKFLPLRKRKI